MVKSLFVVAVLAVPSCTVVGAATGYSLAGSHDATHAERHSSAKAVAAGAFIGLIVDAAILTAAANYELSRPVSICGGNGCDGY
jgi:hypothetical protein